MVKRVNDWCENNNIISDSQFGFRKGRSTVDATFILHSIVEMFLSENKRLYAGFVDLRKAFDSINRNVLWLKLYKLGISGKMLRIIRSMYTIVKSCVKQCGQLSDLMDISIGLKQGENLSPIMFSLFLEDLELYLQENVDSGLSGASITYTL